MTASRFPDVVITHPAKVGRGGAQAGRHATISIDGVDITHMVSDFRVGADCKGAVELDLKLLCGSVRWIGVDDREGAE